MAVGEQIGKYWSKITYEDLSDSRINLPADKMASLKAIFGSIYWADLDSHALFIPAEQHSNFVEENITDKYDSIEELLVQEMLQTESKLSKSTLKQMSEIYGIDINILKLKLPIAEKMLYDRLHESLDIRDT